MQIINSASNMPYVAPTETDSQNREQLRQQTEATLQIFSSYKVSLSTEAKALNSQRIQANSVTDAAQNTNQVNQALKAQNTTRTEQSTSTQLQAVQNTTPAPAAPAEQTTEMNAAPPPAPARDTAQATASPESGSASSQTTITTGNSTPPGTSSVPQTVAPQNQSTPQKPAQEAPMAAAGGMSSGKYNINLSV
ncbi:MAG: hypothetical protein AB1545_08275 [Thermodesulfobacteriota bacterium]